MTAKDKSGFLSAMLCISLFLIAGLLGTGAAENYNLYASSAPHTAQERAELLKAIQGEELKSTPQTTLSSTDLYKALQNPYAYKDPQANLELANTYKALQKWNSVYSNSRSEDNWYYWTGMWLNEPPEAVGISSVYSTMDNPYAYKDPQANLELANTYKALQKWNSVYSNSRSEDNWYYWTGMWLNEPQEAAGTVHAINGSGAMQDISKIYSAVDNPYAYKDPQTNLELANTYKALQKWNSVYSNSRSEDNWYYWTNMWLNGP